MRNGECGMRTYDHGPQDNGPRDRGPLTTDRGRQDHGTTEHRTTDRGPRTTDHGQQTTGPRTMDQFGIRNGEWGTNQMRSTQRVLEFGMRNGIDTRDLGRYERDEGGGIDTRYRAGYGYPRRGVFLGIT